jgi:hypothetical protein
MLTAAPRFENADQCISSDPRGIRKAATTDFFAWEGEKADQQRAWDRPRPGTGCSTFPETYVHNAAILMESMGRVRAGHTACDVNCPGFDGSSNSEGWHHEEVGQEESSLDGR